jgi:ABC-type glutathione transport system ATPase component
MTYNVLEVRGLSVGYATPRGHVRALRDVDLHIPGGSIVGIVGESGCGKSTLLASIIGLLDHNAEIGSGEILFEGRDLLGLAAREVRALRGDRLSMIFQDPMTTLNPVLSIGTQMTDYMHHGKLSAAEKRRRAAEMLKQVGIPATILINFRGACVSGYPSPWHCSRSRTCSSPMNPPRRSMRPSRFKSCIN